MHDYSYKRHASSDRLDQRLGNLSARERRDLVPDLPLGHGVHQVSLKHPTFGYPRAPGTRRFISLVDRQGLRDGVSPRMSRSMVLHYAHSGTSAHLLCFEPDNDLSDLCLSLRVDDPVPRMYDPRGRKVLVHRPFDLGSSARSRRGSGRCSGLGVFERGTLGVFFELFHVPAT
jgi:hypothetical protein